MKPDTNIQTWLQAAEQHITIDPNTLPTFTLHSRTELRHDGVYFIDVAHDKHGNIIGEKAAQKLSDPITLLGIGQDENRKAYRIIAYLDPFTKQPTTTAIAHAHIGTQQGWSTLQDKGINIKSDRKSREKLADYLQFSGSQTQYTIAHTTGWKNNTYFMPNGEAITPHSETKPKVIYMGDTSQAEHFCSKGSLNDWQTQIAQYAKGNSRLMLAIGTALAAPILRLIEMENGGFHLFGDSRDGKTTSAKIGASVWGNPEASKISWNSTALSIINAACARNDNFIMIDEISQAKVKDVAQAAYALGNGQNKGQAHKDGGNRTIIHFKTLFISTGEKPLDTYIKQGDPHLWNAGQAVRLASIPADTGKYKAFDTIHHFPTSWDFAEYLNQATAHYHGTAGKAFIQALQADPNATAQIQHHMTEFSHQLPNDLIPQSQTVAKRFALIYAALELASDYGITGYPPQTALAPIKQCFFDWLARNGNFQSENQSIEQHVEEWFQVNAHSPRFIAVSRANEWLETGSVASEHHAGYRQKNGDSITYFVDSGVFLKELCQSFEPRKVVEVLHQRNWLIIGKEDRPYGSHHKKINGIRKRFYQFQGEAPPHQDDQP